MCKIFLDMSAETFNPRIVFFIGKKYMLDFSVYESAIRIINRDVLSTWNNMIRSTKPRTLMNKW